MKNTSNVNPVLSKKTFKKGVSAEMAKSPFHRLFIDGLKDIYWAEKHLVKELPKIIKGTTSAELKSAIKGHLEETENHVTRLETVFDYLGLKAIGKKCEAMSGLTKEAAEIMAETKTDTMVRDCGIILAAQKVEHYEIATYGCLTEWAKQMGHKEVAKLLYATLVEEKGADQLLTKVAENDINIEGIEEK
ncbi:Ferritin-like metal-binding protein YciE [Arachidicoccus rhizosphaerae]|uniref:Ferritin-like metal-binding protein YciE n=1 Tax=Arachidicoccus rhizosphaerae TaxID=551991 RepID=A0A1H4AJX6_9BACT|nr:ferritin-like domain-containing protein [Arachidicoccus rhizosphaerae]SEA36111.1 Ferritin-like metal-binding protein YciE [Arachidicoccus rhizosphaerae]